MVELNQRIRPTGSLGLDGKDRGARNDELSVQSICEGVGVWGPLVSVECD